MHQEEQQSNSYPSPDIEIDLKPYLKAIFKYWWVIVISMVVFPLLLILYSLLKSDRYTAEANVSLLKIQTQVVLDQQFKTVEEKAPPSVTEVDTNRPDALLAIAEGNALKASVIQLSRQTLKLGDEDKLEVELVAELQGDLIRLAVTSKEIEAATVVANIWATEFTRRANQAYVNTGSDPAQARKAASDAFEEYQKARNALETFVTNDQIDKLQMESAYVVSLLDGLKEQRRAAFVLANTAPINLANRLLNVTLASVSQQVDDTVTKQLNELPRDYNFWYGRKEGLRIAQLQLQTVKGQLDEGMRPQVDVFAEALSTIITKSGVIDLGVGNQYELDINALMAYANRSVDQTAGQIGVTEIFPDLTLADVIPAQKAVDKEYAIAVKKVDELSKQLLLSSNINDVPLDLPEDNEMFDLINKRVTEILNRPILLDVRSPELTSAPLSKNLDDYLAYKQTLEAQILDLQAQRQILDRTTTTTWELYSILDNKAREVEAQYATGAPQARVALEAYPPAEPDGFNILFVLAALFGGLLLGFFIVIMWEIRDQVFENENKPTGKNQPLVGAAASGD